MRVWVSGRGPSAQTRRHWRRIKLSKGRWTFQVMESSPEHLIKISNTPALPKNQPQNQLENIQQMLECTHGVTEVQQQLTTCQIKLPLGISKCRHNGKGCGRAMRQRLPRLIKGATSFLSVQQVFQYGNQRKRLLRMLGLSWRALRQRQPAWIPSGPGGRPADQALPS